MKDLKNLQKKITSIWDYTELELSDFSASGLRKQLSSISNIVNDVLNDLDQYKSCSLCEHSICNDCLDDMAQEFEEL
tara:strand:- start:904 stop:1134 length:231 start_codon:yes stop_codon:yes gene_type:complete